MPPGAGERRANPYGRGVPWEPMRWAWYAIMASALVAPAGEALPVLETGSAVQGCGPLLPDPVPEDVSGALGCTLQMVVCFAADALGWACIQ